MSEQDEDDLFAQEMAGVRRLRAEPTVRLQRQPAPETDAALARRRAAAERDQQVTVDGLSETHIEWVQPTDVLSWRAAGVAHGVFRRLKQGDYILDARLDLHRHTVEQARRALIRFILDCQTYDVRAAIVLHGKGERGERKAVIKSYTHHWLQRIPEVLAFHSAQPRHGGAGALYVLIKKSEKKKQENRERYRNQ
ncbi:DNA endonuclease SmrA [Natronospirillum operosum]|uniref:DNA endonuclease SmrA n=1 Tax=Natronospirillum operosum TaxID=2759953 RepID=A0A4Z0WE81_9GAMM|nr:DNA endonuclease SmrA [Natronospirillum operosum]TGG93241.1 DNA endonuclease SmrA [Natronospirillum operosum]